MKKRLLSILLLCCMLLSLLPAAALAGDEVTAAASEAAPAQTNGEGETGVAINPTNFPDDNFRKFVKTFDTDGDDSLSPAEIAAVTFITYIATSSDLYIKDMKGIEFFTALERLKCVSNHVMTSLDVSKNTALTYLECYGNGLPSLDVSKNTALKELLCYRNNLTSLDVSKNMALTFLHCDENNLTTLDVSKNTALESLVCNSNSLTSLDVTKNAALKGLWCGDNRLTSLDVTQNTALTYLNCQQNALTALDLSCNTLLETLYCNGNQLTALDLSGKASLKELYCFENQLTSLDTSSTAITDTNQHLHCYDNTYAITVGSARTFDLSTLPGSFDVSKAGSWNGGTVDGTILTVDDGAKTVTYTYDCGKNHAETFTLTVEKRLEEQFDLTPGGRYYFDLSAVEMPGKTVETLPDTTLHYVPFTYVGTVDAYSMENEIDTAKQPYVHSLFIADYNVKNYLQRETLAEMNLIYGQTHTAGNVNYTLRAPSVGDRHRNEGEGSGLAPINNEWDTIYQKSADYIKNWNEISSFGQDTGTAEGQVGLCVSRGEHSATNNTFWARPTLPRQDSGFRPVLELPADLPADSLKVVELITDDHMPGETYNCINIIVKKGESFTAPSAEGLPLSDDISADTPMWWVDETLNFYKPGDTVPADVSALYAFYGGFGLFLDRGDGAVEVTPDNYTDIFGDGTASFVVPNGRSFGEIAESGRLTEAD